MRMKSLVQDVEETRLAIEMVRLGARMQMLESETSLSRERLLKLYKEVRGESPPKGMLPFSTDWFMPWQQNIHASLYMALRGFVVEHCSLDPLEATLQAYRMYCEKVEELELDQVLSLTRAWTLVRFFDAKMLQRTSCVKCGGDFVAHAYEPARNYVCGLCHVPARAGKGNGRASGSKKVAAPAAKPKARTRAAKAASTVKTAPATKATAATKTTAATKASAGTKTTAAAKTTAARKAAKPDAAGEAEKS